MLRKRAVIVAAAGLAMGLALQGCEYGLPAGDEPHREFNFTNMGDQPKLKPQRADRLGEKPLGLMAPPAGAVAMGEHPYPYTQEQAEQAATQKNPLQATPRVLARGKFLFENICIACHGPQAAGDGLVTTLFPKPPSLMTQRVRDWTDGRVYHVPMRGQNSMPSHSKQITRKDLWSVIHYIRSLQKKLPVAPPPAKAAGEAKPVGEVKPAGEAKPEDEAQPAGEAKPLDDAKPQGGAK